jgi:hypothetical protein
LIRSIGRKVTSAYVCVLGVVVLVPLPTIGMHLSAASSRASHAPGSQPPSATLLARLEDKKREFEAVDALQRASALFLRRLEGLADDCEVMADAGIGA